MSNRTHQASVMLTCKLITQLRWHDAFVNKRLPEAWPG
jgi:hypothetical protein